MSSGDYCSSIIEWPLRAFVVLLLNCLLKVNEQRFVRELATCPRIMNGNGQMLNAVPFVKKKTKVFSYGMSSSTQCCRHRMKTRGLCKKKQTNVFLHSVFNTYDYGFLCLYTQCRHFDNSKMVNWVNLVQKLTKIQVIM